MQVNPVTFLKEVKIELSKVTWPSRQETARLTMVVIGISLVIGLFLGGVDFILTKVMGVILKR